MNSTPATVAPPSPPPPARRSRSAGILWLVFLVCGVVFGLGVAMRVRASAQLREATVQAGVPEVAVIVAQADRTTRELLLPSTTESWQRTTIRARATGYVRKLSVDIGSVVTAGQLLAEIETPDLDQEFRAAEARLREAAANLEMAKLTSDRYQTLAGQRAVSQQDADERLATRKAAEARQGTATADVERLRELREFQKVTAPFAGTITSRRAEIGNLVTANSGSDAGLFTLEQTDRLRAFASVPQTDARSVQIGQTVELRLREFPGQAFSGTVTRTAGALDPVTRTLRVEAEIPNPDGRLVAGSYAQVRISLPSRDDIILLPASAVSFRQDGAAVQVLDANDTIVRKSVQIGRDLGTQLEIVSGLQPGDRVVKTPSDALRPGVKARVAK